MGRNYCPSTGLLPCCSRYSMFIKRKWSGRRAEVPLEAVVPPDFGGSTAWDFKCKIERNYRSSTVTLPCSSRYNENIKRYSSGTSAVVPLKSKSGPTAPFGKAYIKGPFFSKDAASTSSRKNTIVKPPKALDLLTHPPKVLDLWGIEGGDIDLHLHQPDLHFSLINLRGPCSLYFLGNLRS